MTTTLPLPNSQHNLCDTNSNPNPCPDPSKTHLTAHSYSLGLEAYEDDEVLMLISSLSWDCGFDEVVAAEALVEASPTSISSAGLPRVGISNR